jgi:hypothetical protein
MLGRFIIKLDLRLFLFGCLQLLVDCLRLFFYISEKQILVQAVDVCQAALTVQLACASVVC